MSASGPSGPLVLFFSKSEDVYDLAVILRLIIVTFLTVWT